MTNWNDKQEVLEAVKKNGMALKNASNELKSDKEIVIAALKQSEKVFPYVSEDLKADEDVVIAALSHKYEWLTRYTVEELLEVIKRNGDTEVSPLEWQSMVRELFGRVPNLWMTTKCDQIIPPFEQYLHQI